jgi:hypothetical protein
MALLTIRFKKWASRRLARKPNRLTYHWSALTAVKEDHYERELVQIKEDLAA